MAKKEKQALGTTFAFKVSQERGAGKVDCLLKATSQDSKIRTDY